MKKRVVSGLVLVGLMSLQSFAAQAGEKWLVENMQGKTVACIGSDELCNIADSVLSRGYWLIEAKNREALLKQIAYEQKMGISKEHIELKQADLVMMVEKTSQEEFVAKIVELKTGTIYRKWSVTLLEKERYSTETENAEFYLEECMNKVGSQYGLSWYSIQDVTNAKKFVESCQAGLAANAKRRNGALAENNYRRLKEKFRQVLTDSLL